LRPINSQSFPAVHCIVTVPYFTYYERLVGPPAQIARYTHLRVRSDGSSLLPSLRINASEPPHCKPRFHVDVQRWEGGDAAHCSDLFLCIELKLVKFQLKMNFFMSLFYVISHKFQTYFCMKINTVLILGSGYVYDKL
jgi:hypothetical protein